MRNPARCASPSCASAIPSAAWPTAVTAPVPRPHRRVLGIVACCLAFAVLLSLWPGPVAAAAAAAAPSTGGAAPLTITGPGGLMVGVGVCVIAAAFSVLVFFAVPTILVRRGRQEAHLHCCTPKIALSMCRNPNNPARRFFSRCSVYSVPNRAAQHVLFQRPRIGAAQALEASLSCSSPEAAHAVLIPLPACNTESAAEMERSRAGNISQKIAEVISGDVGAASPAYVEATLPPFPACQAAEILLVSNPISLNSQLPHEYFLMRRHGGARRMRWRCWRE